MPKILYEVDGVEVPSVTTIIGHYKNMAGLLGWYFTNGYELGCKVGKDLVPAPEKLTKVMHAKRDLAGDVGTAIHHLIQCHIQNIQADPLIFATLAEGDTATVQTIFVRFKEWWTKQNIKRIVATEISLTSESHLFGGTMDLVAEREDGTAIIMDWKTSREFYQEMLLQLSAYRELCAECLQINIEKAYIIRLSKQNKSITAFPVEAQDMRHALEKFLALRRIYDMESHLTAIVERIQNDAKRHDNHQR